MAAAARRAAPPSVQPDRPRRGRDLGDARERPGVARRRRPRARPRLGRAILGIAVLGVLLSGVVVVNLAALGQRTESDRLDVEIEKVRDEQVALQAELASRASVGKIEAKAQRVLGLVEPRQTSYVKLPPRAKRKPAEEQATP